ncbi:hypothetical protein MARPO_0070s0089, partial [Marchantia polymorpha]
LFGCLPITIASQVSLELKRQPIHVSGWLPDQRYTDLPTWGDKVYVSSTLIRRRICILIGAPFPICPDGTRAWIEKNCSVFNIETKGLEEREQQEWEIRGKSVFSLGDNPLESSLARILVIYAAESTTFARNLEKMCIPMPRIVEKPDNHNQTQRMLELQPDVSLAEEISRIYLTEGYGAPRIRSLSDSLTLYRGVKESDRY